MAGPDITLRASIGCYELLSVAKTYELRNHRHV